jgi:hypothetical protein
MHPNAIRVIVGRMSNLFSLRRVPYMYSGVHTLLIPNECKKLPDQNSWRLVSVQMDSHYSLPPSFLSISRIQFTMSSKL